MPLSTNNTATGTRESLANMLIENDKSSLRLFPRIPKKGKPGAPEHKFPADRPGEVSNSGVVEGAPPKASTSMSEDYNLLTTFYHQITVTVSVTKIAELLVDRAGVGNGRLLAREVLKAMKAMGVANERILLDSGDLRRKNGALGYETRGFFSWCSNAAQGVEPVPELYRTPLGAVYDEAVNGAQTFAAVDEDVFGDMVEALYNENGEEETIHFIAGSALRRKISSWVVATENVSGSTIVRRVDNSEHEIRRKVTTISMDCGDVELDMSRFLLTPRGVKLKDRTSAQIQAGKRSGLGYCPGALSLRVIQDIQANSLDVNGKGNSAGKNTELDCIIMTEADPARMAKIQVA